MHAPTEVKTDDTKDVFTRN